MIETQSFPVSRRITQMFPADLNDGLTFPVSKPKAIEKPQSYQLDTNEEIKGLNLLLYKGIMVGLAQEVAFSPFHIGSWLLSCLNHDAYYAVKKPGDLPNFIRAYNEKDNPTHFTKKVTGSDK